MPQQKGCNGTIRTPFCHMVFHFLFVVNAKQLLDGIDDGYITQWNDIGCLERKHQIHIDGPVANSLDFD